MIWEQLKDMSIVGKDGCNCAVSKVIELDSSSSSSLSGSFESSIESLEKEDQSSENQRNETIRMNRLRNEVIP